MTKTFVLVCWAVVTASAQAAWRNCSMINQSTVLRVETQSLCLLELQGCQRILHFWTFYWPSLNKRMKARAFVKAVMTSTPRLPVAWTARKTCVRMQLAGTLETRPVATTALCHWRSWRQTQTWQLCPFSALNTTSSSDSLMRNAVTSSVETVSPSSTTATSVCL